MAFQIMIEPAPKAFDIDPGCARQRTGIFVFQNIAGTVAVNFYGIRTGVLRPFRAIACIFLHGDAGRNLRH